MDFSRTSNRGLIPVGCVLLPKAKIRPNSRNSVSSRNAGFQQNRKRIFPTTTYNHPRGTILTARRPHNTKKSINQLTSGNVHDVINNNKDDQLRTPISLESFIQVTKPYWADVDSSNPSPNKPAGSFRTINPNHVVKAVHDSGPNTPILLGKYLARTNACFTGTIKSITPSVAVSKNKYAIILDKSAKNKEQLTSGPNEMATQYSTNIAAAPRAPNSSISIEQHPKQILIRKKLSTNSIITKTQNTINSVNDFKPNGSSIIDKFVKNDIRKVATTAPSTAVISTTQNVCRAVNNLTPTLADKFNNLIIQAKVSKNGAIKKIPLDLGVNSASKHKASELKSDILSANIKNSVTIKPQTEGLVNSLTNTELNSTTANTGAIAKFLILSKLRNQTTQEQYSKDTGTLANVDEAEAYSLTKLHKTLAETNELRNTKCTFPESKNLQNVAIMRKAGAAAISCQNIKQTRANNVERIPSPVPKRIKRDPLNSGKSLIETVIDSTPFAIVEPNIQTEVNHAKVADSPQNSDNFIENMLRNVITQYSNLNPESTKSFANALKNWMNSVEERNLKIESKRDALQQLNNLIDEKNREFAELTKTMQYLNFSGQNATIDFENYYNRRAAIHADTLLLSQQYKQLLRSGYGSDLNWALTNDDAHNVLSSFEEDPLAEIVRICESHGQTNASYIIRELVKDL
ncbi:uncharacterized protein LOC119662244 [Teleopsis dalmanni]|uniref:uncharacterized protein LOC119662244 n=1 Tax=Teleopsis dalmanni TaxID=139649 RepID=UPI0018CDE351|nr:uncharacterized protein LOC119662244 [Teleopsis dalmanni]